MRSLLDDIRFYIAGMLTLCLTFIVVFVFSLSNPVSKYKVYAADQVYYTNKFQITGNTIYFSDIYGKNVCIVQNFTLIYEKDKDK